MRFIRPSVLILLTVLLGCAACTMWGKPGKSWKGATGGEQLEREFWKEIAEQDWKELEKHVASSFILTTPSGSYDRSAALERWKSMSGQEYSLGDFQVKLNGSELVVSYLLSTAATQGVASTSMRVQSVWQDLGGKWLLIAQAHTGEVSPN